MFNAGSAFLPQSFTANMLMLAFAAYISGAHGRTIFFLALAGLLGWPFVGVVALPVALDVLVRAGPLRFAAWSALSAALVVVPSVLVDYAYYKKTVLAALNIALYNVSSTHGPTLYGVEPASYYVKNLLLNFNVVAVMAPLVVVPPLFALLSSGSLGRHAATLRFCAVPMLLWLGVMFSMPHKEERFLFVVYPHICLAVRPPHRAALLLLCTGQRTDAPCAPVPGGHRVRRHRIVAVPRARHALPRSALRPQLVCGLCRPQPIALRGAH
jgi:alpha-1,2-mannosyltransferase